MSAITERRWTRAEVLALPDDGKRYELVDGELLVSPAPRRPHQVVVRALNRLIDTYVLQHGLGEAWCVPGDLTLGSGQVVQPDLFVLPAVPDPQPKEWEEVGVPVLAVEVLSPSTARYDRIVKRRAYQRAGVATYWIIDIDSGLVEVWAPEAESPVIVTDELLWQPNDHVEPLRIDVARLVGGAGAPD